MMIIFLEKTADGKEAESIFRLIVRLLLSFSLSPSTPSAIDLDFLIVIRLLRDGSRLKIGRDLRPIPKRNSSKIKSGEKR